MSCQAPIYGMCTYIYCIAENFQERKLLQIGDFRRENFHGCSLVLPMEATHAPKSAEKTFSNSHKTSKFAKVFFLKIFPLYGNNDIALICVVLCTVDREIFV